MPDMTSKASGSEVSGGWKVLYQTERKTVQRLLLILIIKWRMLVFEKWGVGGEVLTVGVAELRSKISYDADAG
jgi:hypothetical protein